MQTQTHTQTQTEIHAARYGSALNIEVLNPKAHTDAVLCALQCVLVVLFFFEVDVVYIACVRARVRERGNIRKG